MTAMIVRSNHLPLQRFSTTSRTSTIPNILTALSRQVFQSDRARFSLPAINRLNAQLDVVNGAGLLVEGWRVKVLFTPTVPSCSMVTLIGLSIRLKLSRVLPKRFKVDTIVYPGSHTSEMSVNKQLNDKERVAAALENPNLVQKVDLCLSGKTAF